jgi:hypothetical protein
MKKQKKDNKMIEVNIKPLILELNLLYTTNAELTIYALICAGSNANLNPELLIRAFEQFLESNEPINIVKIHRTDLFRTNPLSHSPISLSEPI